MDDLKEARIKKNIEKYYEQKRWAAFRIKVDRTKEILENAPVKEEGADILQFPTIAEQIVEKGEKE